MAQSTTLATPQGIQSSHSSVHSLVEEIFNAFYQLANTHSDLIKHFWAAFQERAKYPFLSEAQGADGLAFALEEFLAFYPDETYLNESLPEITVEMSIEQIKEQVHDALIRIAGHNPHILQSLQEIQEEIKGEAINWSLPEILRALLGEYVANKNAYPY